jgi:outer membrane protein assembly factor BamD (BamD/ComL family)
MRNRIKETLAFSVLLFILSGCNIISSNNSDADSFFENDEYENAIPLFLEEIRDPIHISDNDKADILSKLCYSYIKTDKIIEATAIALEMVEKYPEHERSPLSLLMVGETKWREYKNNGNTEKGRKAKEYALMIFEWYVEKCPDHEYVPDISMRIANEQFKKVQDLAIKSREFDKDSEEKLEATIETQREFRKLIPIYEEIIYVYPESIRSKQSAFILAFCYSNSGQFLKAAEKLIQYLDWKEKAFDGLKNVATAKYHLALCYLRKAESIKPLIKYNERQMKIKELLLPGGENDNNMGITDESLEDLKNEQKEYYSQALQHLLEFKNEWMTSNGRLGNPPNEIVRNEIDITFKEVLFYLPWTYDALGEQKKATEHFKEFIEKFPNHKNAPIVKQYLDYIQKRGN